MFCENRIVDDSSSFVEKDGEGGGVRGEGEEGRGCEPFEECSRSRTTEAAVVIC